MRPREYYERMLSSIKEADVRLVAAIMTEHVGIENAVSLVELTERSGMGSRKIRAILATLTITYGWAIGGESGTEGRWIVANERERELVIADLGARIRSTQDRINALRSAKIAPAFTPENAQRVQPVLFEIPKIEPIPYWRF